MCMSEERFDLGLVECPLMGRGSVGAWLRGMGRGSAGEEFRGMGSRLSRNEAYEVFQFVTTGL